MTRFAARTKVPVDRSRVEIEKLLTRYGASSFINGWDNSGLEDRAVIGFEMKDRRLRFILSVPKRAKFRSENAWAQTVRQRWRALVLAIKGKLESVESGIEEFESAFLANIVMPDGQTVDSHVRPKISAAYRDGNMSPMLPDYSGDKR